MLLINFLIHKESLRKKGVTVYKNKYINNNNELRKKKVPS